jgi:hypothetical protein
MIRLERRDGFGNSLVCTSVPSGLSTPPLSVNVKTFCAGVVLEETSINGSEFHKVEEQSPGVVTVDLLTSHPLLLTKPNNRVWVR